MAVLPTAYGPYSGYTTTGQRLAAPASALTFTLLSGEPMVAGNLRVVEIGARLRSDGTSRTVTVFINGANTNVTSQYNSDIITSVAAARGAGVIGIEDTYGCYVTLKMVTSKNAAGWKRFAHTSLTSSDLAGHLADTLYTGGVFYDDATTVITSIGFDVGFATGLTAATDGWITEYDVKV